MPRLALFVSVAALAIATLSAQAHDGATGVIKDRMDGMEVIDKAMQTIAHARLAGTWNTADVKIAAQVIASHAVEFPKQFPKGSDHTPSQALPTVWADAEGFAKGFDAMKVAGQIIAGAKSEEEFELGFAEANASCTACHDKYRAKR